MSYSIKELAQSFLDNPEDRSWNLLAAMNGRAGKTGNYCYDRACFIMCQDTESLTFGLCDVWTDEVEDHIQFIFKNGEFELDMNHPDKTIQHYMSYLMDSLNGELDKMDSDEWCFHWGN